MLPKLLTRSSAAATTACSSSTGAWCEKINALEPQFEQLDDAALRAKTDEFRQRARRGRDARRPAARGLRRRARGQQAHAEDAPLRRAADRRHGAARRQDRRDAHRRGQDADGDAAGLPERADRQGRARRHGQRLPGAPRRRVDGPALHLPRPDGRRQPAAACRARRSRPPTPPTSPTAPTTSSASTTCATTWSTRSPTASRAACTTRSSTRSTRS